MARRFDTKTMLATPSPAAPPASLEHLLSLHDEAFVRAAYLGILGRPADEVGLHGHTSQLRAGESRAALIVALADSEEARKSQARPLAGLAEFVRQNRPRRPRVWQRVMRALGREMTMPLGAQLRAQANEIAAMGYKLEALAVRIDSGALTSPRSAAPRNSGNSLVVEVEALCGTDGLPDGVSAVTLRLAQAQQSSWEARR